LLDEVLRQRSDQVLAWLQAAIDRPTDPVERLLAVFDALHGWYAEARFRGCAIVNAAKQSPAPRSPPGRSLPNTSGAWPPTVRHLTIVRELLDGLRPLSRRGTAGNARRRAPCARSAWSPSRRIAGR
jgi:AcrR family transcriptional regulator